MKRVLSIGQCGFDHGSITRFLTSHFDVEVLPATTATQADRLLIEKPADLILVNRQFDADGDSGLDYIKHLKADLNLSTIPVMLITNYRNYAEQSVSLGAVPGFGKSELTSPSLTSRLQPYLQADE